MAGNLVVLAGLPGSGKSTIAREIARVAGAVWVRIDSIEQAIRDAGMGSITDAGYRAGYAIAEDNLRLGRDVIADSVNPLMLTRDARRALGERAGARVLEVEVVCSDTVEHRRQIEQRQGEVPGLQLPDWNAVQTRDYHSWNRERLVLDTASVDIYTSADIIVSTLAEKRLV